MQENFEEDEAELMVSSVLTHGCMCGEDLEQANVIFSNYWKGSGFLV